MTPTKKQKLISEQAVYGDLMGLLNDKVYPIKWITSTPNVYHDRKVEDRFYRNLSETMPILRPLKDLTKEITHNGYNDGEPFVPLYELTTAFVNRKWSDKFRLKINSEYIIIEIYSKSLDSWGIHATIDLMQSKLDLLNQLHFDTRNLIASNGAISTDVINPYEVK